MEKRAGNGPAEPGVIFTVRQLKARLEADLRNYMGDAAIADSARIPAWRGNILADHERALCRADRRRH